MDRRQFLRGLGAAGLGAGVLGACSDDEAASTTTKRPATTSASTSSTTVPVTTTTGQAKWKGSQRRVAILGGGIGGMTAAMELAERGFEVQIFEKKDIPGGKARSIGLPKSGTSGRKDLPGEHGFRFFPGFYKHVPDTMRRIPFPGNANGVLDNLVPSTQTVFSRAGEGKDLTMPLVTIEVPQGKMVDTMVNLFSGLFSLPREEVAFFIRRMAMFVTSCDERRLQQWEHVDWFDFMGADRFSEEYRKLLVVGATRNFVAARAESASARTIGLMIMQFNNQLANDGEHLDQVLNGPTNDAWIDPWATHLAGLGVVTHHDATVEAIDVADGKVRSAVVSTPDGPIIVEADHYVCALPVEVARTLWTKETLAAAPELAGMAKLKTEWMNGIQFFLNEPLPIVHGHVNYVDSPWALTSISQGQFYGADTLAKNYGDGSVVDVLSVDISNWDTPGQTVKRPANACTAEEIRTEVLAQLMEHLNAPGKPVLREEIVANWMLDPGITFPSPGTTANDEPLLVNTVGSYYDRPDATTKIPNLFLAADYVRSNIDLATMEGANEAGRRATNGILAAVGATEPQVELFPVAEDPGLASIKANDCAAFARGEKHFLDT